jgi:hypothetical protein
MFNVHFIISPFSLYVCHIITFWTLLYSHRFFFPDPSHYVAATCFTISACLFYMALSSWCLLFQFQLLICLLSWYSLIFYHCRYMHCFVVYLCFVCCSPNCSCGGVCSVTAQHNNQLSIVAHVTTQPYRFLTFAIKMNYDQCVFIKHLIPYSSLSVTSYVCICIRLHLCHPYYAVRLVTLLLTYSRYL